MIPSNVKVFLASHPIDFRKGPDSLLSLVRDAGSDPFNGALYVFRAKPADRIKIVWCDMQAGPTLHEAPRVLKQSARLRYTFKIRSG
jgi:transposase